MSSDEDLKLGDLLRYYDNDTKAAKVCFAIIAWSLHMHHIMCNHSQDLLYRRMRSLVNFENSNKALEKARTKSKDVEAVQLSVFSHWQSNYCLPTLHTLQAQKNQQIAKEKFDTLSDIGKEGIRCP